VALVSNCSVYKDFMATCNYSWTQVSGLESVPWGSYKQSTYKDTVVENVSIDKCRCASRVIVSTLGVGAQFVCILTSVHDDYNRLRLPESPNNVCSYNCLLCVFFRPTTRLIMFPQIGCLCYTHLLGDSRTHGTQSIPHLSSYFTSIQC
jgi:hypothetical protein